jgi:AcrR family transcriptional regulator
VILEAAMRTASVAGLGALTLGRLAKELGVSKSGLYAHFGSKRRLQLETIEAARRVFAREVIEPGLAAPNGLARLEALTEAFLSYVEGDVFPGGCFFAGMLSEFDGQPGQVHDETAADKTLWLGLLAQMARDARDCGELDRKADVEQLAFEVDAALELANYLFVLYRDPKVLEQGRQAIQHAIERRRTGHLARRGGGAITSASPEACRRS